MKKSISKLAPLLGATIVASTTVLGASNLINAEEVVENKTTLETSINENQPVVENATTNKLENDKKGEDTKLDETSSDSVKI